MADQNADDLERLQRQLRQEARDIRSSIPTRTDELRRTLEEQASQVEKSADDLQSQIEKLREIQHDVEGTQGGGGGGLFG